MSSRCALALSLLAAGASAADDVPLDARLERLAALVERDRREHHIPGLALGVLVDGEVVLARGMGVRDLESGEPVTSNTIFAIGSSTKSFTSVLAAMLADDGALDVDDPIAAHFPGVTIAGGTEPTIRDALAHCTGLSRMPHVSSCVDLTPDEVADYAERAELAAPYRTAFSYSNVNYTLAGEAIARAGDSTWHELVAERIFAPLGMDRSTTTLAARDAMDEVAEGYEPYDEDDDEQEAAMDWDLAAIAPAGAINASLDDMLVWAEMLVEDGRHDGVELVSPDALEDLWRAHVPISPEAGYGSGFFVGEKDGVRLVHHGGNVPGFATQVVLMPDHDTAVVLLSNIMIHPLQDGVIGHAVDCLFGDELPSLDEDADGAYPTDLERYAGRYWFSQGQVHMTALVKDDVLHLDVPGQTVYELRAPDAEGKWTFAMTDQISVSFAGGDERAASLTMYQAGFEFVMPRDEPEPAPDAPPIDELLGAPADGGLLVVGEIRFPNQGVVGDNVIMVDAGGRVREESDLGRLGAVTTVIDGERGWTRAITDDVEDLDSDAVATFLTQTSGVFAGRWRTIYSSFELGEAREVGDVRGVVVHAARADGSDDELVFAIDDGRLLQIGTTLDAGAMGSLGIDIEYGDWREVGGRLVPHRAVSQMLGIGRVEIDVTTIETDYDAPDALFAPLEDPDDAR